MGFLGGSVVKNIESQHCKLKKNTKVLKNPPDNAGDMSLISGSGRSPGEENDNPLQDSCLENPMDRRALWATVHRATKSQTLLSNLHPHFLSFSYC